MLPFRLVEREIDAGARELLVEGELDLAVADQLRAALEKEDSARTQVLIGLENCEFIDSTGIAVIVQAHCRLAEKGGRIALYGPTRQVRRILSVTGLTENGLVFETATEALAASTSTAPALDAR
jgi:anti-sigma B factor antagonist